jgi:hypothetical protein
MIVTARALKALQGSVKHWERLVSGKDKYMGPDHCPLCGQFNTAKLRCKGCPIATDTQEGYCHGTPYYGAVGLRTKAAMRKELSYLRKLLRSCKTKTRKKE